MENTRRRNPQSLSAAAAELSRIKAEVLNQLVDNLSRDVIINHMVELQPARLDAVFHALGDSTRRQMLRTLADGQRTVGELAAPYDMSLAAASKHIKALEKAGLVRRTVRGRTHLCRLEARPLEDAHDWIGAYERFWTGSLDVLEGLLRGEDAAREATEPPRQDVQGDDQ